MSDIEATWKPVPGYPEYEVSSNGEVRNIASGKGRVVGRVLRPRPGDLGHLSVCLRHDNKGKMMQVHRLVAIAFIGQPTDERPDIAHGDGDSSNNCVENLRWASRSENEGDKIAHGRSNRGEQHGLSRLTEDDIRAMRELSKNGMNNCQIAKQMNVSREHARDIVNRKIWKHVE